MGSEMCIRDRRLPLPSPSPPPLALLSTLARPHDRTSGSCTHQTPPSPRPGRGSRAPRPRVIDIESSDDKDALSLISYTQFLLPHKPQTAKPQKIKSEAPKLALRAGGKELK